MARSRHSKDGGKISWGIICAWLFCAAIFLYSLVGFLTGHSPFASEAGVGMLLSGGMALMGLTALPVFDRWDTSTTSAIPNIPRWLLLIAGMGLWCAAPLVLLAGGYSWTDSLGSRSWRRLPVWLLAMGAWGASLLALSVPVREFLKNSRRR
ncbi:hypothetical protein BJF89_11580 [Corynebacterium sp. CNJ-954]|nr:hypothetical protein BJF89_11580 [Corynebacterium sp. CNJ-954]